MESIVKVALENFRNRREIHNSKCLFIVGGHGSGKTRIGKESTKALQLLDPVARESILSKLNRRDRLLFEAALKNAVYVYFDSTQHTAPATKLKLDLFVAAGLELAISDKIASFDEKKATSNRSEELGFSRVLETFLESRLQKRVNEITAVIFHIDNNQANAKDTTKPTRDFNYDILQEVLYFRSHLCKHFFVLPLITGSIVPTDTLPFKFDLRTLGPLKLDHARCLFNETCQYDPAHMSDDQKTAFKESLRKYTEIPITTEAQTMKLSKQWCNDVWKASHFQIALRDTGLYPGLMLQTSVCKLTPYCRSTHFSLENHIRMLHISDEDVRSVLEMMLLRTLVTRSFRLPSGRTIGDMESTGWLYLSRYLVVHSEFAWLSSSFESDDSLWVIDLPFIVFKELNRRLHPNCFIPDSDLFLPSATKNWTWDNANKLHASLIQMIVNHFIGSQSVEIRLLRDMFLGATSLRELLDVQIEIPESFGVYREQQAFSDRRTNDLVLCSDNVERRMENGVFICSDKGVLVDQRWSFLVADKSSKPLAIFVKLHHQLGEASAGHILQWYHASMEHLKSYQLDFRVVLVYLTREEVTDSIDFQTAPGLILIHGAGFEAYWRPTLAHRGYAE